MTNKEAKEELSRLDLELIKMVDCGNKASERMSAGRRRKAMRLAIKALENQSKYENALELAVRDSDKSGTDVWCEDCGHEEDERLNKCWECGMKYYKRKAGLEVADD